MGRPRIALIASDWTLSWVADGFLRESAAGLSVAPPAMCHMVAVNQTEVWWWGYCGGCCYF